MRERIRKDSQERLPLQRLHLAQSRSPPLDLALDAFALFPALLFSFFSEGGGKV
jgi:hypothetical protein